MTKIYNIIQALKLGINDKIQNIKDIKTIVDENDSLKQQLKMIKSKLSKEKVITSNYKAEVYTKDRLIKDYQLKVASMENKTKKIDIKPVIKIEKPKYQKYA